MRVGLHWWLCVCVCAHSTHFVLDCLRKWGRVPELHIPTYCTNYTSLNRTRTNRQRKTSLRWSIIIEPTKNESANTERRKMQTTIYMYIHRPPRSTGASSFGRIEGRINERIRAARLSRDTKENLRFVYAKEVCTHTNCRSIADAPVGHRM